MRCPGCGAAIDDKARFCPECGAAQAQARQGGEGPGEPGDQGRSDRDDGWERLRARREAQDMGQGPRLAASGNYADIFRRFVAFVIDQVMLGAASWIVGLGLGVALALGGPDDAAMQSYEDMFMIVGICLSWGWFALFESSPWQATPGKRIMGLMVTDLSGRRLSFARATGRFFGKFLSGIILMLGYVMAAFTRRRQALHDILAGTLVLRRD